MFSKQKKGTPYINLAVFSLAAAGVATIVHKMKKLVRDKAECIGDMFKKN